MAETEGRFNKALDAAVARHVKEQVERHCPACLGTGTVYVKVDEEWVRQGCQRCARTGLRSPE